MQNPEGNHERSGSGTKGKNETNKKRLVHCPICQNNEFDEDEFKSQEYPQFSPVFTKCVKCGTVFFIFELKANWFRWGTQEHIEWLILRYEAEQQRRLETG